jgi:hypothetical protein
MSSVARFIHRLRRLSLRRAKGSSHTTGSFERISG